MITQERYKLIKNYVDEHGIGKIDDLCEVVNSSQATVRRDLIEMEQAGLLRRIYGGAESVKNFAHDVTPAVRHNLNHVAKISIARSAVESYVSENDYLFLDAGTSTLEMVPFLAKVRGITVVTNSPEIALACLKCKLNTQLIGGKLKEDTHAAVGQQAIDQIKQLNFAASFIGTNGIDRRGKLTTPDPDEAAVKRAEIAQAAHAYVLADPTKIGKRDFAVFADFTDVIIITTQLDPQTKQALPDKINLDEVIEIGRVE